MTNLKEVKKKIILVGDGGVGKTSLIRRYVVDKFDDKYIATIGSKITAKELQIDMEWQVFDLKLQIWDILGQRGFSRLQSASFRGSDGAFLVVDITKKESLKSLETYWIPQLRGIVGSIPLVILANKSDLIEYAEFNVKELEIFASNYKAQFYLTSARNGENVKRAFNVLGKKLLKFKEVKLPKPPKPKTLEVGQSGIVGVIDRIIDDFCTEYGELQDAMPILRKQFELSALDVNHPTIEALKGAIERLTMIEMSYRVKDIAEANRSKRLKWIKEMGN